MSTKAALKAAKVALDKEDYSQAIEQANSVLSVDGDNYFAKLFLGRAYEKQQKFDDAAKHYSSASRTKPDDVQAWLGLCSVYEAQGSSRLSDYCDAVVRAVEIYGSQDDRERAQIIFDKLVGLTKGKGNAQQVKHVLSLMLPGSSVYDVLEGRIPQPAHTYMRLIELTEAEEDRRIKEAVAERRTRIGARLGQVTLDVKREVFGSSELERLYRESIDWSTDDEIRRQYEEKLLQRAYELLTVLPSGQKAAKLDEVLTLAEGMVIIHHPFLLAWDLVLESRDLDDLRDLDVGILREYVELFPNAGTARVIKSWLQSELSPFPEQSKGSAEAEKETVEFLTPEDRLLLMTEGIQDAEDSAFAHRLFGEYLIHLEEHQSAMEIARLGLKALTLQSDRLGMTMQNTRDALNSVLASALVHYQAPRYHAEARDLFEGILARKSRFTPALIGLGLILEEIEDFGGAIKSLSQALEESKGDVRVGAELAWCKAQNGDYVVAAAELEELLGRIRADDPRTRDLRAQTLYRIGVCLWESDHSKASRKNRNGAYGRFLAAIKTNVNFAPAYTSLGFWYEECAKDKKRARQCYQKAFELSPAEIIAAERLARAFAEQGDWDIVEVVAQRVVDSGRTRPAPGSKKPGVSWPHSALGVVQMNRQDYQRAIVSFLAALRISPDDYQSYVGLGESYHNSGRYNSALRTLNYALDPPEATTMNARGEHWFAKYMLANVHRELGDHDEAILRLRDVLVERPAEFGVLTSLLQTFVDRAYHSIEIGVFGQALSNAKEAIQIAKSVLDINAQAFNAWKAIGDACSVYSYVQAGISEFSTTQIASLLKHAANLEALQVLSDVDSVKIESLTETEEDDTAQSSTSVPLLAAILSYKEAIHCTAGEIHAQAVAWYNLGWAEQRAHICSGSTTGKRYLKAAVRCFKRAIELEAGNAEFWNALGVVTTTLNAKVAQHAFVRSLHLNELNAKVWANLGVLYLLQNDVELAHQAFGRSQSTDPEYAHAWVGEGLISLLSGQSAEAFNHFTHAFEIAGSSSVVVKSQYSTSSFDNLLTLHAAGSDDLTRWIQPLFALRQLRSQNPAHLACRHLAALLLERVGDHTAANEALTELCALAEAEYERTESSTSLGQFALAKSDLARNQLVTREFSGAVANAETALDLTSDGDSSGLDEDSRRKLRLSSHLTAGLAQYHLGEMQESVAMFRSALIESSNDPDVVCSLVQVLWAQGGEEERLVAREQLIGCIEHSPDHVGAVTLLGAIALMDDDQETAPAIQNDLVSLRAKDGLKVREQEAIESLASALATLNSDNEAGTEALAALKAAIMAKPSNSKAWLDLASMTADSSAATVALKTSSTAVPPNGSTTAARLSVAFASTGSYADGQRATFLAPWETFGWRSMNQVSA